MLPLVLSITLVLGAGSLVYAMRARRELLALADRTESAWLELDDVLQTRSDLLRASLVAGPHTESIDAASGRIQRVLASQAEIRRTRDLLQLGATERQIRTLSRQIRAEATDPLEALTAVERAIVELTDSYDGYASVYNLRLQRLPTSLIARLEGLGPRPLIEFVEPFGQSLGAGEPTWRR